MGIGRRKRGRLVSRQDVINQLREVAFDHGERISVRKFGRLTGIPESRIYAHFDSWGDVREEAGLERHTPARRRYTDDDVLEAFHGVAEQLGRFPSSNEFSRYSGMSVHRIFDRFGSVGETIARYRRWLVKKQRQQPEKPLERVTNPTQLCEPDNPDRDIRWMRQKWYSLRVGFELRSSDFRGRPADICDLLICLDHDWPACPVKVFTLHDMLGYAPEC